LTTKREAVKPMLKGEHGRQRRAQQAGKQGARPADSTAIKREAKTVKAQVLVAPEP